MGDGLVDDLVGGHAGWRAWSRRLSVLLLPALLTLGACTTAPKQEDAQIADAPPAFFDRLAQEYRQLAAQEVEEYDWFDAWYFNRRAEAAEAQQIGHPEEPERRDLSAQYTATVTSERAKVLTLAEKKIYQKKPVIFAELVAAYDCWLQELEEDLQSEDIDRCKADFDAAMAKLQSVKRELIVLLPEADGSAGAVAVTSAESEDQILDQPFAAVEKRADSAARSFTATEDDLSDALRKAIAAAPTAAQQFIVTFNSGTTEPTAGGLVQLVKILAEIHRRPRSDVRILGHADRAGPADLNLALSTERAEFVQKWIEKRLYRSKAPNVRMTASGLGEDQPRQETADGTVAVSNRRVEVSIR